MNFQFGHCWRNMVNLQKDYFPEAAIRIGALSVQSKTSGWEYVYGTGEGAQFDKRMGTLDLHVWLETVDGCVIDIEWLKQYRQHIEYMSKMLEEDMKKPEYIDYQNPGVIVYPIDGQRVVQMSRDNWVKYKFFRYSYKARQQYRWRSILSRMYGTVSSF